MATTTDDPARPPVRRRRPIPPGARLRPSRPLVRRSSRRRARSAEVRRSALRRHGAIGAVLACYALAALIVPTATPAAVGDDWVYARSVEILLREGELRVLDLSVVTLLFQIVWGALFALLFGESFGVLRLSTVTMVGLGGWACYGLCRELGVDRGRSALGAAAYLFNPLGFVLAFSFMTDPHFAALLVVASLGYLRGLRPGPPDRRAEWALVGGSLAAASAFLVRQQGALIPLAVTVALLLARRLRADRAGAALFVRINAAPAVAIVGYYVWLFFVNGVPEQQGSFTLRIREAGWASSQLLIERMTFIETMYVGLFVLPIAAAALVGLGRLLDAPSALGWGIVFGWACVLIVGLMAFAAYGRDIPPMPRMPYVPQYLGPTGLGPSDIHGGRRWLVGWRALDWATGVCAVASLLFALAVCRQVARPARPDATRLGAGVLVAIGAWQAIGVLPPSFHFRDWIVSVDRYLLPLLPIGVCLMLWAVREVRLALPVGWTVVAAFAVFSVAGTRDFLVLQGATWELARTTTQQRGVPLTKLDGGASWGGYHLWEYSHRYAIPNQTPGGPWWIDLFAPVIDSSYVVASAPIGGYVAIDRVAHSAWLDDDAAYLYLLRRRDVATPP